VTLESDRGRGPIDTLELACRMPADGARSVTSRITLIAAGWNLGVVANGKRRYALASKTKRALKDQPYRHGLAVHPVRAGCFRGRLGRHGVPTAVQCYFPRYGCAVARRGNTTVQPKTINDRGTGLDEDHHGHRPLSNLRFASCSARTRSDSPRSLQDSLRKPRSGLM
jgi:hypothetical protein